jgi:transposase
VPNLFTAESLAHLATVRLTASDRFVSEQLVTELEQHQERLRAANHRLREFAATASLAEREARAVLGSIPQVGVITADVILAELGDWRRFGSQAEVLAMLASCRASALSCFMDRINNQPTSPRANSHGRAA